MFNLFNVVEQAQDQQPTMPSCEHSSSITSGGDSGSSHSSSSSSSSSIVVVVAAAAVIGYQKNRRVVTIRTSYS